MEESERKRKEKQAWLYVKEDEQQQVSRNTFSSSGWGFWLMGFGVVDPSPKLPEVDYYMTFMALYAKNSILTYLFKNLVLCDIDFHALIVNKPLTTFLFAAVFFEQGRVGCKTFSFVSVMY